MRIKTQYRIAMVLFGAILLVVVVSVIMTSQRVQRSGEQEKIANDIAQGASELGYLTNDYLIYRENQQLKRWQTRFVSFSSQVAGLRAEKPEQQVLVRNIEKDKQRLKEVFDSVTSVLEGSSPNRSAAFDPAVLQVSWSRMAVQIQSIVSDASRLSQIFHFEAERSERTSLAVVFTVICVFCAYFFVNYLLVQRRTLKSIETLQVGTAVIGSGNLDFVIEGEKKDEIGDLSRAFNRMTSDLKTVTASKADLEQEIAERKKAEEALRDQREWLRVTLSSIGDAVMTTDTGGRITFLNSVAQSLTGWQSEEAAGQPIETVFRIINENTREPAENIIERVLRQGSIVNLANHTALITLDGRETPIEDSAAPIKDRSGQIIGVVLVFHDVTEQRRIQAALSDREAQLRTILENITQGVVVSDLDGRLLYWNRASLEMHGYSSMEECLRRLPEFTDTFKISDMSGTDLPVDQWPLSRVLRGETLRNLEVSIRRVGSDWQRLCSYGGSIVSDELGNPLMAVVTISDITAYKQMEHDLKAALAEAEDGNRLLHTMMDGIPVGIAITGGPPDFALKMVSRDGLKMSGQPRGTLIEYYTGYHLEARNIFLADGVTRPKLEQMPLYRASRLGEMVRDNEMVLYTHDGTRLDLLVDAVPVLDAYGNIVCAIYCWRDITERKQIEEELKKSRDELELRVQERTAELRVSNKALMEYAAKLERLNEELQEFAFVASHDLQEPLRKIQTFSNMVVKKYQDNLEEQVSDYLLRITKSAKRMSDLLRSLLDYSRVATRPNPFEPVNLADLANDVISDLELAIRKAGATVEIGDLPIIDADAVQIRQLLQNLIANSMKFCRDYEKAVIKVYGHTSGSICSIFVEDNGIGFEEEYVNRIFKPFQQLHARSEGYEGTGIGLAICRKIVDRHEGKITAKSALGQGATFIIQLPVKHRGREAG